MTRSTVGRGPKCRSVPWISPESRRLAAVMAEQAAEPALTSNRLQFVVGSLEWQAFAGAGSRRAALSVRRPRRMVGRHHSPLLDLCDWAQGSVLVSPPTKPNRQDLRNVLPPAQFLGFCMHAISCHCRCHRSHPQVCLVLRPTRRRSRRLNPSGVSRESWQVKLPPRVR